MKRFRFRPTATTIFAIVFFAMLLLGACYATVCAPAEITADPFFSELQGYAAGATGGLGGVRYVVTNSGDYSRNSERPLPGTLRYGIEVIGRCGKGGGCALGAKSQPVWITFNLSAASSSTIILKGDLRPASNITIDGSGQKVSITTAPAIAIFGLNDVKNIVINNLRFFKNS